MSLVSETLRIRTYAGGRGRIGMRLAGPLDVTGAATLMEAVSCSGARRGDILTVHLEDVTVLDAAGVNALVYVQAFVLSRGGRLRIASSNPGVSGALGRAGLDRLLLAPASDPAAEPVG